MRVFSIPELMQVLKVPETTSFNEDFFITDITFRPGYRFKVPYPCKFNGVICMFCMEGHFTLTSNLDTYNIGKNSFAISLPGDIIGLYPDESGTGKIRLLALSDKLLSEIGSDVVETQIAFRHRVIKADIRCKLMVHHFRNLFKSIILQPHAQTHKSLAMMVGAMSVELQNIWMSKAELNTSIKETSALTDTFRALVAKYHSRHHDVKFYAGIMGVTTKHLAAVVKRDTGKSALDIVVDNVIMEAKFYLSHSDLPIKEIAYELNFSNQMDFYRFFLRHCGITPSDFRNTALK